MKHKPGYIVMLTLLIISVAVALITAVVRQSFTYQRHARLARDQARARMLVLSSLEIAASKLSLVLEKEGKADGKQASAAQPSGQTGAGTPGAGQQGDKQATLEPLQKWLLKVLPEINQWQAFEIEVGDSTMGTVNLYLASQQGKIDISAFEKELMQPEQKETDQKGPEGQGQPPTNGRGPAGASARGAPARGAAGGASAGNQAGAGHSFLTVVDELFKKEKTVSVKDALKKVVTDLGRMPEDATELLRVTQFAPLKGSMFVSPQAEKKPLYLMDLFSVGTGKGKINPWLLSASTKTLLGIGANKEVKIDESFVKKLKPRMRWSTDWDTVLAPVYGKKLAALEKDFVTVLADEFEATAFSVVSYCTVGTVTQKVYALLELTEPGQDLGPKSLIYKVSKLYWLS